MKAIFVTGTDTAVGKTIACGLLGRYLLNKGYSVITQKWVQTGSKGSSRDLDLHLKLMQKKRKDIKGYLPYLSAYTFRFAASAHLAAGLERKRINTDKIREGFRFLSERFNVVIVEGTGGALVPISKQGLLIDIARELGLPVLIVAANRLGTINHTLLTIEAIKRRNMKVIGIIFNNQLAKVNKIILKDNPRIIATLTNEKILGVLPWLRDRTLLYKAFIPIGQQISAYLKKSG